jgi:hypothetical protein
MKRRKEKSAALFGRAQIGLDRALVFHGHRMAVAIHGLAHRQPDPALAYALFLDIVPVDPVEADTHPAFQQFGIVERAFGIGGKPVGQCITHGKTLTETGL